jgi:hypothetical protein
VKYWTLGLIVILALAACNGQQTPNPEITEPHYFTETGHAVRDDFLRFFNTYGGVESFGYPLTEEIIVDGWRVQYFEKGRLEYHPENEPAYQVTIGWLGDLLHRRCPPIPPAHIPPHSDPRRRYFPQTGHTLSGDFLDYFETHGGSVRFGLPISEPFLWKGRLAQDFQSARFFWTPDTELPVTLEHIGRVHLKASGLDGAR